MEISRLLSLGEKAQPCQERGELGWETKTTTQSLGQSGRRLSVGREAAAESGKLNRGEDRATLRARGKRELGGLEESATLLLAEWGGDIREPWLGQ